MLRQSLQQKLLQKLSPQQIQLMKLLQLPTIALEQRIKEELELNPALEEGSDEIEDSENSDEILADEEFDSEKSKDEDFSLSDYMDDDEGADYKTKSNNNSPDEERKEIPFAASVGFQEILESQLGLRDLSDHQYQVASYLLGNLDDDGYLRREIDSIVDDVAFSQNINTSKEELLELLKVIQEFDPAGIGARDLQECLLLQLTRKEHKTEITELAIEVVKNHMEEFSKKHYDKISKKLHLDDDKLKQVINEILKLNPRPGNSLADSQKSLQEIIPDFTLTINDGELELTLNSRNAPELRTSGTYQKMLEEYTKSRDKKAKEAVAFVKQKIEGANWFIDAIKQRQNTLLATMQTIVEYQREYFLEGDETKLKPMILKNIADITGLDISTVSRVTNSKYIQTPFGTFLLKSFFSESLSTDSGEEVSSREVKKILADSIAAEDKKKPITDDALAKILNQKGYNIARRTVAKYREMMEIPVARLRKEL